jgi:DNA (cytosine-5)-methyltransferase 1
MDTDKKTILFRRTLLNWYKKNGRIFPWRKINTSKYKIIISEVLLQRTKAETVSNYFNTFFSKYPNWEELSNATIPDLEEILKPIGLYKHRAKRLYKIAQGIKQISLKKPLSAAVYDSAGLSGLYIANAYELFMFQNKKPLLDKNMSRILKRFYEPGEFIDVRNDKKLQDIANKVVNVKACKELNWAILDYAALVCKVKDPACSSCKLNAFCLYYKAKSIKKSKIGEVEFNFPVESKNDSKKDVKVLSLFSGCGGMDLGLEGGFKVHKGSINEKTNADFIAGEIDDNYLRLAETRFKTVFANDILQEAKLTWVKHFTKLGYDSNVFWSDSIVDLVKSHKAGFEIFPEDVDIVTGGFPCQDFSVAGKRNGFSSHKDHLGVIIEHSMPNVETRGQLYIWMKEVIEITKPKIFIAENVKGLVNFSNVKDIIQEDFSAADDNGYIVLDPQVLHAANYGVPQSRERVIFIGIKKSALNAKALSQLTKVPIPEEYNPYPKPSHRYTAQGSDLKEPQILKNIFSILPEPDESDDLSQIFYSKAKYMGAHCQGQTEVKINSIAPTIRAEHHGNIEYRRLSSEHGGKNDYELKKGLKERR